VPKKTRNRPEQSGGITRRDVIIGLVAAVVLAAVGVTISMLILGPPDDGKSALLDLPTPAAPEPTVEGNAAADLLANKSYDDMTQEERDTLKAAVTKAFDNAQFRASSLLVPAIDVFRIDGRTRASRQFKAASSPGGEAVVVETLTFYCDSPEGNINAFQYTVSPVGTSSKATVLKPFGAPFEGSLYGLDWSQAKDVGFRTVDGHRLHGFEMPFDSPSSGRTNTSRTWFDVDTARVILREQPDTGGDEATYTFDWSIPAPLVIPADQPVAPCSEAVFHRIPSARPAGTATAQASSTPAADAAAATPAP
jgi:hypothetical protein